MMKREEHPGTRLSPTMTIGYTDLKAVPDISGYLNELQEFVEKKEQVSI